MRAKLTKRLVDSVRVGSKDTIVWDTELKGLALKVTPSGGRSYFLYYRTKSGQQRRPSIGRHGAITVEEARQIAKRWLADVAQGGDVSQERQIARKAETISELGDRYLSDYASVHKKPRSVITDRANLLNHINPLLGPLKIRDITRADIERSKHAIRDGKTARRLTAKPRGRRIIRGGEGIANRVVALLSKMFACAEEWGLRDNNPARGIRKFREHRKDRFLDADEVGRLLRALEAADANRVENPLATAAIRLLLFTGMRSGEALGLRWSDVDLSKGYVRLRDSKTGARAVPLSSQAVAALKSVSDYGERDLVFPGATKAAPIALTRPWYRIRAAAEIDSTANIHCLRHTFASWSVMGGLSLAQVGAVLGHRSAQTTLRYADHVLDSLKDYSERTGKAFSAMAEAGPRHKARPRRRRDERAASLPKRSKKLPTQPSSR